MFRDKGLSVEGLDKPRYKGLKAWFDGLSIIYITAFLRPKGKVDKSTNLHIYNMGISPMHKREGLSKCYASNPQNPTGYKEIPNTPIDIQTISSGHMKYASYKGLVNMLDIRFEGLIDIKV